MGFDGVVWWVCWEVWFCLVRCRPFLGVWRGGVAGWLLGWLVVGLVGCCLRLVLGVCWGVLWLVC